MNGVRTITSCLAIALAGALLAPCAAHAQQGCGHGWCDRRPYGDYCGSRRWGRYGAKQPVKTVEEARARLEEFYAEVDVVIGEITERKLHFEAEIDDEDGTLVDRVIIDKRSGRIRSIL